MSRQHHPSATTRSIVAALANPPRMERLGPVGGRFVHSLRLISLYDRAGCDPVPELAVRMGGVDLAAKALVLAQAISVSWPEKLHVSRFCCCLLSHDEATIGNFVDSAARGDRVAFEGALCGLIRDDRLQRLWEPALALAAAELRAA